MRITGVLLNTIEVQAAARRPGQPVVVPDLIEERADVPVLLEFEPSRQVAFARIWHSNGRVLFEAEIADDRAANTLQPYRYAAPAVDGSHVVGIGLTTRPHMAGDETWQWAGGW